MLGDDIFPFAAEAKNILSCIFVGRGISLHVWSLFSCSVILSAEYKQQNDRLVGKVELLRPEF